MFPTLASDVLLHIISYLPLFGGSSILASCSRRLLYLVDHFQSHELGPHLIAASSSPASALSNPDDDVAALVNAGRFRLAAAQAAANEMYQSGNDGGLHVVGDDDDDDYYVPPSQAKRAKLEAKKRSPLDSKLLSPLAKAAVRDAKSQLRCQPDFFLCMNSSHPSSQHHQREGQDFHAIMEMFPSDTAVVCASGATSSGDALSMLGGSFHPLNFTVLPFGIPAPSEGQQDLLTALQEKLSGAASPPETPGSYWKSIILFTCGHSTPIAELENTPLVNKLQSLYPNTAIVGGHCTDGCVRIPPAATTSSRTGSSSSSSSYSRNNSRREMSRRLKAILLDGLSDLLTSDEYVSDQSLLDYLELRVLPVARYSVVHEKGVLDECNVYKFIAHILAKYDIGKHIHEARSVLEERVRVWLKDEAQPIHLRITSGIFGLAIGGSVPAVASRHLNFQPKASTGSRGVIIPDEWKIHKALADDSQDGTYAQERVHIQAVESSITGNTLTVEEFLSGQQALPRMGREEDRGRSNSQGRVLGIARNGSASFELFDHNPSRRREAFAWMRTEPVGAPHGHVGITTQENAQMFIGRVAQVFEEQNEESETALNETFGLALTTLHNDCKGKAKMGILAFRSVASSNASRTDGMDRVHKMFPGIPYVSFDVPIGIGPRSICTMNGPCRNGGTVSMASLPGTTTIYRSSSTCVFLAFVMPQAKAGIESVYDTPKNIEHHIQCRSAWREDE